MRILIQKVSRASVTVNEQVVGSIGHGLALLVGAHGDDNDETLDWMVNKIVNLRIFPDESGKMNASVLDQKGELLVVSQFTLYGDLSRGRRPDFLQAAPPEKAKSLIDRLVQKFQVYLPVAQGQFGATMNVSLVNQGPITLWLEK